MDKLFGWFRRKQPPAKAQDVANTAPLSEDQIRAIVSNQNPRFELQQLIAASGQSVGKQRELNEDSLLAITTTMAGNSGNMPFGLYVIADGMGGLAEETRELFGEAGLEVRSIGDRALTAKLGDDFQALFVRAQDIPEFVADGAADAGITGWDLVAESQRDLTTLLDLTFGRCRLVVAVREESPITQIEDIPTGTRVATVFPRVTGAWFAGGGRQVELVPVSGAVEVAPHLGIADVVAALTSTGSTLRVNGLRELDTVLVSTARLVAARPPDGRVQKGTLYDRRKLKSGNVLKGPAVVLQMDTTTLILPGASCSRS